LKKFHASASFFLTGRFYRNPVFATLIENLKKEGHYLGPHSNEHLLYCDWNNRDSLLVSQKQFLTDLEKNYREMAHFGIQRKNAKYFLPPYEWYNDSISEWTKNIGLQLVNYTPGTLSHADYTNSTDKNYRSSAEILNSIITFEKRHSSGLNGFILLMHIGAGTGRTDKFYNQLPVVLKYLTDRKYKFVRIDNLLQ
jgi:endoglucanase